MEVFTGELQKLSLYGAEILGERNIPVLTNLKIHLQVAISNPSNPSQQIIEDEIYAKVLINHQPNQVMFAEQLEGEISQQRSRHNKEIYVHFTTVPSNLKTWIKSVINRTYAKMT